MPVSGVFVLALALLIGLGAFNYEAARRALAVNEQRAEGRRLLVASKNLFDCMLDAETGERGYLLTGDSAYLEPYSAARETFPERLADVRALLATPAGSSVHFDTLEPLLQAKMAELEEAVRLRQQGNPSAALAVVKTDRGKQAMDRIRQVTSSLEKQTLASLEAQANEASAHLQAALVGLIAGGVTGISVLLLAYLRLRREMRGREKLNRELEDRVRERTQEIAQRTQEMARSREDLRVTLESIGDAVLATDDTGTITLMNKEAERLTGWAASEALRQPLEQVFVIVNEETRRQAENQSLDVS
jgi:CHASE3 domain sensor protein